MRVLRDLYRYLIIEVFHHLWSLDELCTVYLSIYYISQPAIFSLAILFLQACKRPKNKGLGNSGRLVNSG